MLLRLWECCGFTAAGFYHEYAPERPADDGCYRDCFAAVLLQIHRYFKDEDAVFFSAAEPYRADSNARLIDETVIQHLDKLNDGRFAQIIRNAPDQTTDITHDIYLQSCEVRQGDYYNFLSWSKQADLSTYRHPDEPAVHQKHIKSFTGVKIRQRVSLFIMPIHIAGRQAAGLPTTDEWRVAAQGKDRRLYPWGIDTPDGIRDLGSGVSEWTVLSAPVDSSADNVNSISNLRIESVLSGGNALQKPYQLYAMAFTAQPTAPGTRSEYAGFRCVFDSPDVVTRWQTINNQTVKINAGAYRTGIPADSRIPFLLSSFPEITRANVDSIRAMYRRLLNTQGFRVKRHEVNVWEFMFFLYDPLTQLGVYDHPERPAGHDYTPYDWDKQVKHPMSAVYGLDWWTAYAVAAREEGRLPSEEQWLRVYTNNYTSRMPWGTDYFEGLPADRNRKLYSTESSFAPGNDITPGGITHLAGNVSEWTDSFIYQNGRYEMIAKGTNYLLPGKDTLRPDFRLTLSPHIKDPGTGVRIFRDASE
ncbi:hypothetical protein CHS0354_027381 [Potamilus streckersoni]|uniref:Sulfatase-modifying factor enzyme-like domain-containing protein n=1 Tax=Potamilus streckersoni TaxID=2493646 RepID=A0AAE0SQT4_9BIVA|nr:hypothetical protein CHS0354_027381 [Potamilus streckersoni]